MNQSDYVDNLEVKRMFWSLVEQYATPAVLMLQHQTIHFAILLHDRYLQLHGAVVMLLRYQQSRHSKSTTVIYQLVTWMKWKHHAQTFEKLLLCMALVPMIQSSYFSSKSERLLGIRSREYAVTIMNEVHTNMIAWIDTCCLDPNYMLVPFEKLHSLLINKLFELGNLCNYYENSNNHQNDVWNAHTVLISLRWVMWNQTLCEVGKAVSRAVSNNAKVDDDDDDDVSYSGFTSQTLLNMNLCGVMCNGIDSMLHCFDQLGSFCEVYSQLRRLLNLQPRVVIFNEDRLLEGEILENDPSPFIHQGIVYVLQAYAIQKRLLACQKYKHYCTPLYLLYLQYIEVLLGVSTIISDFARMYLRINIDSGQMVEEQRITYNQQYERCCIISMKICKLVEQHITRLQKERKGSRTSTDASHSVLIQYYARLLSKSDRTATMLRSGTKIIHLVNHHSVLHAIKVLIKYWQLVEFAQSNNFENCMPFSMTVILAIDVLHDVARNLCYQPEAIVNAIIENMSIVCNWDVLDNMPTDERNTNPSIIMLRRIYNQLIESIILLQRINVYEIDREWNMRMREKVSYKDFDILGILKKIPLNAIMKSVGNVIPASSVAEDSDSSADLNGSFSNLECLQTWSNAVFAALRLANIHLEMIRMVEKTFNKKKRKSLEETMTSLVLPLRSYELQLFPVINLHFLFHEPLGIVDMNYIPNADTCWKWLLSPSIIRHSPSTSNIFCNVKSELANIATLWTQHININDLIEHSQDVDPLTSNDELILNFLGHNF